ncbi:hypothetical protein [Streptomyces capillispiralis]|uniref:Uncharacterized protein n=1 Tax=Streptomyces capillispiralis TaxID=68182 RepID=A0A561SGX5_9ACTN|nr:hypothetical protein [Streptomyces capillispiralis]TWF74119.1 hypothetical protein FHX78_12151 [Streptomyces capillispiralis]GHE23981.1 hypothetical protein GCM10017779_70490 [Streptomyces capillispiralis]
MSIPTEYGGGALALVERAEAANAERARAGQPARFAAADVDALRAVATPAEHHGGRLSVNPPPRLNSPAARRPAAPPATAQRPGVAAPSTAPAKAYSSNLSEQ